METFTQADILALWRDLQAWVVLHVLTLDTLIQVVATLLPLAIAWGAHHRIADWCRRKRRDLTLWPPIRRLLSITEPLALPVVWLGGLWLAYLFLASLGQEARIINVITSLLTAWVVIRVLAGVLRGGFWARIIAYVIWAIAALNILGLLDPTAEVLDGLAFKVGEIRLSALGVVKGVLTAAILLWGAIVLSRFVETQLRRSVHLTPSIQVLSAKLAKITLITVAVVIALQAVGVDLTAFAVFGGAVGVGIGFGLQKVVSNLISGVILLLDRSIKPGDVIEVEGAYGWINTLGARYVSVVTRDGMEYLIPNEDLITQRVINWSFSSKKLRLRVPFGISYDSDVHKAVELSKEAASEEARVIDDPPPNCLMRGFGDSSIDLELRFWITDPENGTSNIKSAILMRIWEKFQAHNIGIPYPHREVIIKEQAWMTRPTPPKEEEAPEDSAG